MHVARSARRADEAAALPEVNKRNLCGVLQRGEGDNAEMLASSIKAKSSSAADAFALQVGDGGRGMMHGQKRQMANLFHADMLTGCYL
jgi:hypothetical protein